MYAYTANVYMHKHHVYMYQQHMFICITHIYMHKQHMLICIKRNHQAAVVLMEATEWCISESIRVKKPKFIQWVVTHLLFAS